MPYIPLRGMTFDDWLIALHVLSAFALVGALTIFSIGFVALRSAATPGRVLAIDSAMRVAELAVRIGVVGTIVFGVWLAIALDAYELWNLWVILAIAGWAVATELSRRSGAALDGPFDHARRLVAAGNDSPDAELVASIRGSRAQLLHWAGVSVTLLVLVDMIWKPGA